MPKYLKEDGNVVSDAINKVEDILREAGIQFDVAASYIFMTTHSGQTFRLVDKESGRESIYFPRMTDSERFRLEEN